jgi:hypothetical protein
MIRRITLTLGMGVAVLAAGSRNAPSQTVASVAPAPGVAGVVKPVGPKTPRTIHRSGYIVASS